MLKVRDRLTVIAKETVTDIYGIIYLTVHTTLLKESDMNRSDMCDGSHFHCMIVLGYNAYL